MLQKLLYAPVRNYCDGDPEADGEVIFDADDDVVQRAYVGSCDGHERDTDPRIKFVERDGEDSRNGAQS